MASSTRPVRLCDSCGQVDDHPRHVFAVAPGDGATPLKVALAALEAATAEQRPSIEAQLDDDDTVAKHMDCCRTDGCPDGTCDQVTRGAEDKRGDALVRHLTSRKG